MKRFEETNSLRCLNYTNRLSITQEMNMTPHWHLIPPNTVIKQFLEDKINTDPKNDSFASPIQCLSHSLKTG